LLRVLMKRGKMSKYNIVFEMNKSTVVTEYEPLKKKSDSYQSEAELEKEFIKICLANIKFSLKPISIKSLIVLLS